MSVRERLEEALATHIADTSPTPTRKSSADAVERASRTPSIKTTGTGIDESRNNGSRIMVRKPNSGTSMTCPRLIAADPAQIFLLRRNINGGVVVQVGQGSDSGALVDPVKRIALPDPVPIRSSGTRRRLNLLRRHRSLHPIRLRHTHVRSGNSRKRMGRFGLGMVGARLPFVPSFMLRGF